MFRSRPDSHRDPGEPISPRVAAARDAALDALAPKLAQAREAVGPPLASARERLAPHVETALDTTRHVAADRVRPAAEVARERLAPVVNRAAEAILDAVVPAVTAATEAYERSDTVDEIRRRGEAAVATLRTEGPEFARRRWPLIVGFVLTGATVGAVAGIVTRKRSQEPAWTPPLPPAAPAPTIEPAATPNVGVVDDVGVVDVGELGGDGPAVINVTEVDSDEVDPLEAEATRSEQ